MGIFVEIPAEAESPTTAIARPGGVGHAGRGGEIYLRTIELVFQGQGEPAGGGGG